MENSCYIASTESTNELLAKRMFEKELSEGFIVYTDFQSEGKGQKGNSWESEKGKNLLFSILLFPLKIKCEECFLISQITSLAIKQVLDHYTSEISIKWPNDIYWKEKKIAGILIENTLRNNTISQSIVGVGLNVNQKVFKSDAVKPISLLQISNKEHDRLLMLQEIRKKILEIYKTWPKEKVKKEYMKNLYRKEGYHFFSEEGEGSVFDAKIVDIKTDGQLELQTREGIKKHFYFKEVEFI